MTITYMSLKNLNLDKKTSQLDKCRNAITNLKIIK